ncbi:hypothetical protein Bca52824_058395 [Brassica carinata]|uniref:Uncharacterized protein n=1 Tax=Brassica carinata TaxID=52824 RepID=A0A8X7QSF1_BRACI|nr:hypothetical protein Bca52824_058395 [Brassica carinata]
MIGPALSHDPLPGPKTKTLDRSYRRKKKRSSKVEGRNRFRPICHSPVRIHPKAMTMAYPVNTLDVRAGVPFAVCFAFSLRSTMFGSFFQQSRLDRLLDLIPIKSSLQIA